MRPYTEIFPLRCREYRKRLCRLCGVRGGLLPILHVFRRLCLCGNRCGSLYDDIFALRGWKKEELGGIEFELNSILVEKWQGKAYRLVIQRQKRIDGELDLWEGEYTYRCILTNDYESSEKEIVKFYNLRGGKERIFDDMNNGFGWKGFQNPSWEKTLCFFCLRHSYATSINSSWRGLT